MAFRRNNKKKAMKKRGAKRRVPRTLSPMNQTATIIETIDLGNTVATNGAITQNTFSIGNFARALQCSTLYKWYKAEYVEWSYIPFYDTYQNVGQPSAANVNVPYFYSTMNRTQDLTSPPSAVVEQFMLSQGAVPRKFTKKIVVGYKPNWCIPGLSVIRIENAPPSVNGLGHQGLKPSYDWLACPNADFARGVSTTMPLIPTLGSNQPGGFQDVQNFPQATVYNGHVHYIDQGVGVTPGQAICTLRVRVKWVFKNPSFWSIGTPTEPEPKPELPV